MNTIPLLLRLSLDLTRNLQSADRLQRLLSAIRDTLKADAAALLVYEDKKVVVRASHGLTDKGQEMSWSPYEQPRLQRILNSKLPVVFPSDSPLADPFDEMLADDPHALHSIHSCMGIPLRIDDKLLGCLTADALDLDAFDNFEMEFLETLGALSSVALKASLEREALERTASRKEEWAKSLQTKQYCEFIGEAPATLNFKKELSLVAKSPFQLLLTGETGVGKEVAARVAHKISPRSEAPFIAVNCAAIPENMVESELFGHVKGAFTGAYKDKPGQFEIADGGTLFLDELGDLPLNAQAKLLRVLQENEVQRVGGTRPNKVDVRIIAATNKNLEEEVKRGNFRNDLFHRIAVFPLKIPPLRERIEDIPLLARDFALTAQKQLHSRDVEFLPETLKWLMLGAWPGNVRELRNVILAGVLRAKNRTGDELIQLRVDDFEGLGQGLKEEISAENSVLSSKDKIVGNLIDDASILKEKTLKEKTDAFKRMVIKSELEACGDNWSQVAKNLGMDRSNLFHLAKRIGLR